MLSYFEEPKQEIGVVLKQRLEQKACALSGVNSLGRDVCQRLYGFASQGKMIRGGLVYLGYRVCRNGHGANARARQLAEAAVAMELFQSALLVHDDIMDRDLLRRGQKTLHVQYAEMAGRAGAGDAAHLGEGLGICAGDVGYFLAFEILAGMKISPAVHRRILQLCARELSCVGVAQMQDLFNGTGTAAITNDEILRLYLYKTGRYTFSLPLMVGGLLAGAKAPVLKRLEKIGEYLGIIFQIKDDELGLFAETEAIGKQAGSDVREGKKTLYYSYLFDRAPEPDLKRLSRIFGNGAGRPEDLQYVRDLVEDLGIRGEVAGVASTLARKARALIGTLRDSRQEDRQALLDLLEYSLARSR
jgi:geranylgeranyl diphosphate synthase type I